VRTVAWGYLGGTGVALTETDRELLRRCLKRKPGAWAEFVDRFMGLIWRVVEHTAYCRSVRLSAEEMEDICAQIMAQIVDNDYAILRRFAGRASLTTYLTVVARRICVHELVRRALAAEMGHTLASQPAATPVPPEKRIEDKEQVQWLLKQLNPKEAAVVRMYHLDGKSYREISDALGVPQNSVGPILHRAREKMKSMAEKEQAG